MHAFSIFCICTCSAQLSMFHMEKRSRNMLIIIIIITHTCVERECVCMSECISLCVCKGAAVCVWVRTCICVSMYMHMRACTYLQNTPISTQLLAVTRCSVYMGESPARRTRAGVTWRPSTRSPCRCRTLNWTVPWPGRYSGVTPSGQRSWAVESS